ncbi:ADP-ribose pyrophosphatase [[Bacillus] enclensis]|uniref:ADP-ribose pyrophosphatase YjhB, NUDIX family n=1 Tax=[Bacillus] enclensis TaxID=1402860 RepID=A0A0V8HCW3_9BACI|nr:NUDIX hydrolase N-terminal domain-containing protein [[Bacillus] enclensis]KSU60361.1 ADP-ribose pyrophosphatase [[Bacillus] enclensis]SCC23645.1 ADP-ribose pyrophosphatase YjhB, NUDIX family [[Bacillus] enclensis]
MNEILNWAKQIQALAQNGLTYGKDKYDLQRYEELRTLAVEMMSTASGVKDHSVLRELFANETGYQTPKVDVRGVVFNSDNEILLVRELEDSKWSLPGGWADIGVSVKEMAAKEVEEESGYIVEPFKVLAVFDKKHHPHPPSPYHVYKIFIQCRSIQKAHEGDQIETDKIGFFNLENLPVLSEERVTESQLKILFNHATNPMRQTDFD